MLAISETNYSCKSNLNLHLLWIQFIIKSSATNWAVINLTLPNSLFQFCVVLSSYWFVRFYVCHKYMSRCRCSLSFQECLIYFTTIFLPFPLLSSDLEFKKFEFKIEALPFLSHVSTKIDIVYFMLPSGDFWVSYLVNEIKKCYVLRILHFVDIAFFSWGFLKRVFFWKKFFFASKGKEIATRNQFHSNNVFRLLIDLWIQLKN